MKRDAAYWIERLDLQPHPEGGYYRESYRATEGIGPASLAPDYSGARHYATAIYFLLGRGEFSSFHRLRSDELWHLYEGGPLTIHVLDPKGEHHKLRLGANPEAQESFQQWVPGGHWFGADLDPEAPYVLVGCTVSPGFEYEDFELAERAQLLARYPQHDALIRRLTEG